MVRSAPTALGGRGHAQAKSFFGFPEVLEALGIQSVDGIMVDLGISSHQIMANRRGFTYMREAPLDMRMNPADTLTAADILMRWPASDLTRILSEYGEIRHPSRMAEAIVRYRLNNPLNTSENLKQCLRREYGERLNIKMLAKLFQSLRIAVNDELSEIRRCCEAAAGLLTLGGRLVVIAYHSLEDGFVKNFMRNEERGCVCPPSAPRCVCGKAPRLKRINRKAIVASCAEVAANPASRSARLRAAEKTVSLIVKQKGENLHA